LDRLTRKELKTDKFALEVTHSLAYVTGHRKQALVYGGIGLAIIVLVAGIWYYRSYTHRARQNELAKALQLRDAVVTVAPIPDDPRPSFPSNEEKEKAIRKAFQDIASRHAGSDEADIANFHLAVIASDAGNLGEAEKYFRTVVEGGEKEYANSARLSLAEIYASQGKTAEAERLLKEVIANPSVMVSKEQATISLARVLATSKPAEARKLLEPLLKDQRGAVSRNATTVAGEIPAAPPAK
jgi:predicted negative regulator of RcsB-dependent stress response